MQKYRNSKDGCKRLLINNSDICKNVDQCTFTIVEDYTFNNKFWAIVENTYMDITIGYDVNTALGICEECDIDRVSREIERY